MPYFCSVDLSDEEIDRLKNISDLNDCPGIEEMLDSLKWRTSEGWGGLVRNEAVEATVLEIFKHEQVGSSFALKIKSISSRFKIVLNVPR